MGLSIICMLGHLFFNKLMNSSSFFGTQTVKVLNNPYIISNRCLDQSFEFVNLPYYFICWISLKAISVFVK